MKITKSQLKKIIKEELESVLSEDLFGTSGMQELIKDTVNLAFKKWGGPRTKKAEKIALDIAKDLVPKSPSKVDAVASVIASRLCIEISGGTQKDCLDKFI